MKTVTLQIPLAKELKIAAQKTAHEMGFSSLQEIIRIFLRKLANKTLDLTFEESVVLSKKAEKRYEKMAKEIERGIGIHEAKDVDDLMKQLSA